MGVAFYLSFCELMMLRMKLEMMIQLNHSLMCLVILSYFSLLIAIHYCHLMMSDMNVLKRINVDLMFAINNLNFQLEFSMYSICDITPIIVLLRLRESFNYWLMLIVVAIIAVICLCLVVLALQFRLLWFSNLFWVMCVKIWRVVHHLI